MDYGMGNIHSIVKALELYASEVLFTSDPAKLRGADALVLPGDGAFRAAVRNLSGSMEEIIREHIHREKPLLGVCIGFQVLFENSDETNAEDLSPTVEGLGILSGKIRRFRFDSKKYRVPHMGWNNLLKTSGDLEAFNHEYMYFIHSYRAESVPEKYVIAECEYGGTSFPAAVRKDSVLAVQFHPEKSSHAGLRILEEWVGSI